MSQRNLSYIASRTRRHATQMIRRPETVSTRFGPTLMNPILFARQTRSLSSMSLPEYWIVWCHLMLFRGIETKFMRRWMSWRRSSRRRTDHCGHILVRIVSSGHTLIFGLRALETRNLDTSLEVSELLGIQGVATRPALLHRQCSNRPWRCKSLAGT